MLMIWTDCDREGENIGEEVASVCRKANRNITVRRARFSAIIAQYASTSSLSIGTHCIKANPQCRAKPGATRHGTGARC